MREISRLTDLLMNNYESQRHQMERERKIRKKLRRKVMDYLAHSQPPFMSPFPAIFLTYF